MPKFSRIGARSHGCSQEVRALTECVPLHLLLIRRPLLAPAADVGAARLRGATELPTASPCAAAPVPESAAGASVTEWATAITPRSCTKWIRSP